MGIKLKEAKKNYIPDMTSPLGKGWNQPNPRDIEIDNDNALMSTETFHKLLDYSHSIPSAAYEGKMWRGEYYENNKPTGKFYLRWYGLSDKPGMITGNTRDIIIV